MTCACGRPKSFSSRLCRTCYSTGRTAATLRVCVGCRSEFFKRNTGGNKGLYCSRGCAFRDPKRQAELRARALRMGPVGLAAYKANRPAREARKAERAATRLAQCLDRKRLKVEAKAARLAERLAKRVARPCPECDVVFVPARSNQTCCSSTCNSKRVKRIDKQRRRARERVNVTERVEARTVFARDKWRCQLCGTRVRRGHANTPDSPELDHIVPLAHGGSHTYENTQCLCRQCNGAKGARTCGQLRLCG